MTSTVLTTSPFENKRWIEILNDFLREIRIDTKEQTERDHRGAKLDLWRSQKMFVEELATGLELGQRSFAFLKSRQLGITTVSLAVDVFWLAMFPGTRGALVTDTDANRMKFRIMIKNYIASFPRGFFGASFAIVKGKDNKDFIHFTNGSTLDFLVAGKRKNESLGEGSGYSFVHSTEVANYGDPEGLQSFRETLSDTNPNRLYISESTAHGHNHWKTICEEHQRDNLTKRFVFIGWWAKDISVVRKLGPQPEPKLFHMYGSQPPSPEEREKIKAVLKRHGHAVTQEQLAWYRWRQADDSSTDNALDQNQPWLAEDAFVLSGYSFFQNRVLARDLERITTQINIDENGKELKRRGVLYQGFKFELSNQFLESKMTPVLTDPTLVELRVWEDPQKSGIYSIGLDPAWGRSGRGDNSCISVWRSYADKIEQVAEYAANTQDTRQCAWVLAYLAGAYRNCHLNIEISGGVGLAVLNEFKSLRNQLQQRQFENEESSQKRESDWSDFLANARWFLYSKYDSVMRSSNTTQFNTTRDLKFMIMNLMRDVRAKDEMIINSLRLVEEMLTVVQDEDEIAAPGHNKDDRVMAAALALVTWNDMQRPNLISQGMTYDAVNSGRWIDEDADLSATSFMNRLVTGHFRRAELAEQEREENPKPKWMRDRNL